MLILLLISVVLGAVVAIFSGIGFLFWVVSIVFFVGGLPVILIIGIIHGEVEYAQDRADYREMMKDIAEDVRMEEYLEKMDEISDKKSAGKYIDNRQYYDNRQVHYHSAPPPSETTKIQGRRKNS